MRHSARRGAIFPITASAPSGGTTTYPGTGPVSSNWVLSNASVAFNSVTDPNGGTTACALTDDATNNVHYMNEVTAITASDVVYYFSAGARTWACVQLNNGSNASAGYFNLSGSGSTGSIQLLAGSNIITGLAILALSGGWYQCTVSQAGLTQMFVYPASGDLGRVYTGTTAVAINFWGLA